MPSIASCAAVLAHLPLLGELTKSDTGADMMEPGDSGGPVFKGNSAYGVANCEYGTDENQALYVAVDYVESGLSVTVLTTP